MFDDSTAMALTISSQGLKASDANGFSDPYVKVYLLPGVKKVGVFVV